MPTQTATPAMAQDPRTAPVGRAAAAPGISDEVEDVDAAGVAEPVEVLVPGAGVVAALLVARIGAEKDAEVSEATGESVDSEAEAEAEADVEVSSTSSSAALLEAGASVVRGSDASSEELAGAAVVWGASPPSVLRSMKRGE